MAKEIIIKCVKEITGATNLAGIPISSLNPTSCGG